MKTLTRVSDLLRSLGVSANRVVLDPAPGTATVRDLVRFNDGRINERLYELVDGTLVEKAMGYQESTLAILIGRALGKWSDENGDLGNVSGADGGIRLSKSSARLPDVSFTYWDRFPDGKVPADPVSDLAPDLAVEVLSRSNRPGEMNRTLKDYFRANVRLVWYVDPKSRSVTAYTSPTDAVRYGPNDTLDGGDVLPGFTLTVASLFGRIQF